MLGAAPDPERVVSYVGPKAIRLNLAQSQLSDATAMFFAAQLESLLIAKVNEAGGSVGFAVDSIEAQQNPELGTQGIMAILNAFFQAGINGIRRVKFYKTAASDDTITAFCDWLDDGRLDPSSLLELHGSHCGLTDASLDRLMQTIQSCRQSEAFA